MITPADQAARDAVVERLDENMVVEAGAGTGKTSCLVGRIVALIRSGRARMGGVAAITFTEAAAGELRTRIGESLERAAADGGLGQEERANCEASRSATSSRPRSPSRNAGRSGSTPRWTTPTRRRPFVPRCWRA